MVHKYLLRSPMAILAITYKLIDWKELKFKQYVYGDKLFNIILHLFVKFAIYT
jgi:hypothetical protein